MDEKSIGATFGALNSNTAKINADLRCFVISFYKYFIFSTFSWSYDPCRENTSSYSDFPSNSAIESRYFFNLFINLGNLSFKKAKALTFLKNVENYSLSFDNTRLFFDDKSIETTFEALSLSTLLY